MFGTIVNALAIIVGGITGVLFKNLMPEKMSSTIMKGLALCVTLIGIQNAMKINNMLLVIFSIVFGAIIGELVDLDLRLNKFGEFLERKIGRKGSKVSEGFVTASLLFCVGAMAIVGSIESGLTGNNKTLLAKSVIDGVTSIVFASTMGIGVIFSSVAVFIYQGSITLLAGVLKSVLLPNVISDISAVGGLLILALGLNMLEATKVKVANLLPAVFIPIIYQAAIIIKGMIW